MRWLALVGLCVCACDRVLHLAPTVPADAADLDAVFAHACPPSGTVPAYASDLHHDFDQTCSQFSASSTELAMASCFDVVAGAYAVFAGPVDQPLTVTTIGVANITRVALADDGVAFTWSEDGSQVDHYQSYSRQPDGSWAQGTDLIPPEFAGARQLYLPPSRGPLRRVLGFDFTLQMLVELSVDGGGGWSMVRQNALADLGLDALNSVQLSGDALRFFALGFRHSSPELEALYADRATVDAPFGTVHVISGLFGVDDFFVTEDCTRAYVTGLGRVFYQSELAWQ